MLTIHAPKGTPALYPNHHVHDPFNVGEREVILPRNVSYRVEKQVMKDGVRHLTVSLLHGAT